MSSVRLASVLWEISWVSSVCGVVGASCGRDRCGVGGGVWWGGCLVSGRGVDSAEGMLAGRGGAAASADGMFCAGASD